MDYSDEHAARLARGAGLSIIGKFAGRLLAVIGDVVAARVLGPALFGLYGIGWTLFRVIGLLAPLGLPNGVLHFMPPLLRADQSAARRLIRLALVVCLVSGVLIGTLLLVSSGFLSESIYRKPQLSQVFRMFSVSVPLVAVLSVAAALTRSTGDMRYSVMIEDVGQPLLGLILLIALYFRFGASIPVVIAADVLSIGAGACLAAWAVRQAFAWVSTDPGKLRISLREVLAYSVPTALAGTFSVFVFWVDRVLVGFFLPSADNGLYQAASQISVLFVLVIAAFNAILSPMFSNLHASGDRNLLEETFRVGTKWGLYVSMPVFLLLCVAPREVLSLVFGAPYGDAWAALVVLCIGQIINVATGSVGSLLMMTGHERTWLRLASVALMLNIVLCSILIPRFGILGAGISTSISLDAMYLVGIFQARVLLGVWPYDGRFVKGLGAALACSMLMVAAKALYVGPGAILVCILVLIACTIFPLTLLALGSDREDAQVLRLIRARWPRR